MAASMATSMAESMEENKANNILQKTEKSLEKKQEKEEKRGNDNEPTNEPVKELVNTISSEVANGISHEAPKEALKEAPNEAPKEAVIEVPNEISNESALYKESTKIGSRKNESHKDKVKTAKTAKTNIILKGGNTSRYRAKVSNSNRNFKGYNKIRSTGKIVSSVSKFSDSYAVIFPNALPVKQILWGLEPLNKIWRYCSIVYARPKNKKENASNCSFPLLNSNKSEISTKTNTEQLSTIATSGGSGGSVNNINKGETLTEGDYDYYVHWEKLDRRLDCWIPYEHLRSLEKEPDDGLPCIKDTENVSDHEHAGIDKEYLREHEENTKLKTINKIKIGKYQVDTWYFSPYPKEYQNIDILYICEFCLSFFKEESELIRHTTRCEIRHPPGNEIYRADKISIFEMDGNFFRIYCENLCFLSKLFLDHKTLKHRVNLFLFYVITEYDELGYHITGYFSKEKYSKNNVSCILTLPQHQKKGYGRFLINFSYFLSQKEKRTGTPERPLSDLGLASYMTYWHETLLKVLLNYDRISISELSEITSIETNDILTCLEEKDVLKYSSNNEMFFYINTKKLSDVINKITNTMNNNLDRNQLHWISYDYYLALHE